MVVGMCIDVCGTRDNGCRSALMWVTVGMRVCVH